MSYVRPASSHTRQHPAPADSTGRRIECHKQYRIRLRQNHTSPLEESLQDRRSGLNLETVALVPSIFRWGVWVLVGAMTLSALGNFASSSGWERFLNGPVALLLALLCLVVALGGEVTGR